MSIGKQSKIASVWRMEYLCACSHLIVVKQQYPIVHGRDLGRFIRCRNRAQFRNRSGWACWTSSSRWAGGSRWADCSGGASGSRGSIYLCKT